MNTVNGASSSRRSFLRRVGAGGAAALAANQRTLFAQGAGAPRIWTQEHSTQKGSVKLALFRKRRTLPRTGETPPPILFLVHGSMLSSRPTFDLSVPGIGVYSMMDVFAIFGFDVWTVDCEGYGRSSKTAGSGSIATGVEDLKAAAAFVQKETGQDRMNFFGEAAGALRVGAYAMAEPDRVGRLVLGAFTYTGKGSAVLAGRAGDLELYRTRTQLPRDRDLIRGSFASDKEGTTDPNVADAVADAELPFGDSVPAGPYLDMATKLPLVDPLKVGAPVLLVRGQYDEVATEEDLIDFFEKLPNPDKQLVVLAGMAHSLSLGLDRDRLWHVMRAFLEMPPRRDRVE